MTIKREPTITGTASKAWKLDLDAICKRRNIDRSEDGTVAMWLVEAPWAHMAWHSYAITLLHLRPLARLKGVNKLYRPDATHEIWVQALHPKADLEKWLDDMLPQDLDGGTFNIHLMPNNYSSQFVASRDEVASGMVLAAVQSICDGRLSPDTDYVRHWMVLFGDCMIKDKQHAGETRIIVGGVELVVPPQPGPKDTN